MTQARNWPERSCRWAPGLGPKADTPLERADRTIESEMKLSSRLCVILVLLLPVGAPAADPELVKLLPPDSNLVIGIRPGEIAGSALVEEALAKASSEIPELPEFSQRLSKDALLGLEELLIAVKIEPGADQAEPAGIAVARGDFSDDAWRAALCGEGCGEEEYQGFKLAIHESDQQTLAFVALSDRLAAIGPVEDIRSALDRRGAAVDSTVDEGLIADIAALAGHPIWLAARGPFDLGGQEGVPPMASGALEGLKSIGIGLSLDDPLSLSLDLVSTSEEQAAQLYQAAQALLALSETSGGDEPSLYESLALSHDGARITAQLQVPVDQLKANFPQGGTEVDRTAPAMPRPLAVRSPFTALRVNPLLSRRRIANTGLDRDSFHLSAGRDMIKFAGPSTGSRRDYSPFPVLTMLGRLRNRLRSKHVASPTLVARQIGFVRNFVLVAAGFFV